MKLIEKYLDSKSIRLPLIFAIIYFLLFNSAVLAYKFGYYKADFLKAILELAKDSIYIYLSLFIIFLGLTIHRLVFIIGTIFLFITGAIASYYLHFFHISPTTEMMGTFFSTDPNELYEIVSVKLIIWLTFCLAIAIYSLKYFSPPSKKLFVANLLSATCLLITINNIITPQFKLLKNYFPIQYLHNSYIYLSKNSMKNTFRENISHKYSFSDLSDQDIIVVLVIGESARFDHFAINGYHQDTTPYLSSMKNLFSFKAQSSSNHTYLSVPSLLSRHTAINLDKASEETSILSIFTMLGYRTNWIGTQSLMKYLTNINQLTIYDEANFAIIPGGSALFKMNDYDEKMLPYIKNLLTSNDKQLLVVHTSGSHWDYSARYPKEFQKFIPGCDSIAKSDPSTCDIKGLINNYDNSILYTDFFLYNLMDLLKSRNAFLIYVADHAESLGENGCYGHGGPMIKEQTTIPFIIWVSDEFKARYPTLVTAIMNHLGNEISHDYVFHSLLDCVGINSEIIDKNLSLCNGKSSG
jgi:glucan phosphoethanolaminetransferase (alkaline phosphatase superfamily)